MAEGSGSPDVGETNPQSTSVGDKTAARRTLLRAGGVAGIVSAAGSLAAWLLRNSGKNGTGATETKTPGTGATDIQKRESGPGPTESANPTDRILQESEIGGEKVRDLFPSFVTDVPGAASNYKLDERPERSRAALYNVDNHAMVVLKLNVQDVLQFIEQPEAVGLLINCSQDEKMIEISLQKHLVRKLLNQENQGKPQKDHALTIVFTDKQNEQLDNVFSGDNTTLDPTFPKGTMLVSVSPERQGAAKSNPNLPDRIEFSEGKNTK